MFERLPSGKTYVILLNPGYEDAWKEPIVEDIINSFTMANRAIIVGTKPRATYIIPPGRTFEDVAADLLHAAKEYGLM